MTPLSAAQFADVDVDDNDDHRHDVNRGGVCRDCGEQVEEDARYTRSTM